MSCCKNEMKNNMVRAYKYKSSGTVIYKFLKGLDTVLESSFSPVPTK
jgi:hypothetical protein